MSTWRVATLGPAGTDHEAAARRYCEHRALDYRLTFFDVVDAALPFVERGLRHLAVVNGAHPDVDLLTTLKWREVGIVDMFVLATKPLALVSRLGVKPMSIAIMPSTRGYVDLSRWERVERVTAKPVALQKVLDAEVDSAIVSFGGYEAHRDQLHLHDRIGPVECGWLVFARRTAVREGILAPQLADIGGVPHTLDAGKARVR